MFVFVLTIYLFISTIYPSLTTRDRQSKYENAFLSMEWSSGKCRAFIADLQPVQLVYPTVSN